MDTLFRPVTFPTASLSRSAPSLQPTNTSTGGRKSFLSWKRQHAFRIVRDITYRGPCFRGHECSFGGERWSQQVNNIIQGKRHILK